MMMKKWMGLWVAALVLAGCTAQDGAPGKPLLCHVGGTMRPVLESLAKAYEQETGQPVEINSAGSGELLANIELRQEGDLYVSHDPFLDIIMHRQLADDGWTIGELFPVLIVQKGNPKEIRAMKDLARPDVRLALTDFKLSTLGRMLPTIFKKSGMDLAQLNRDKNITIHRSGSYVANLVVMRSADAALVWKAVADLRKQDLDSIQIADSLPIPHVDAITSATKKSYPLTPVRVTICSLRCSDQPEEAEAFMRFIASEKVAAILESYGFGVSDELRRQEYQNGEKCP
jgi:ABC-type molybdate transport system substrate-binding protein